ncbi:MAG: cytochrome c [Solirubrobacteraceae bacterium]|nr:cytochrome c [Solirubrobacteraceae bacterium]
MTILIIAAAFVALALLVVLGAMRSGPRRGPEPSGSNAGFIVLMVGITVFGLGVPAYAVVNNADNTSDEAIHGVELTAAETEGREQFRHNCATCHTLADAGASGRVGPNLDDMRPQPSLTLNAIEIGRAGGAGQMPQNLLQGEDAENVANYIAAVAGR